MMVFIDCEFNGYQGQLISMALVAEDGREMYCQLPIDTKRVTPWVADNVMPVIGSAKMVADTELPFEIESFLAPYSNVTLLADWPDDARFFCEYLIIGPGERVDTPPLRIEIMREDADSDIPHNALCDARGIRDMYLKASNGQL